MKQVIWKLECGRNPLVKDYVFFPVKNNQYWSWNEMKTVHVASSVAIYLYKSPIYPATTMRVNKSDSIGARPSDIIILKLSF